MKHCMKESPLSLHSLPFEGSQSAPPRPEDQPLFVCTHINQKAKLHLLVVSPDTDLSALQCGLIKTKIADDPNSAFILPFPAGPLPERNQSDQGSLVTLCSPSTILVNDQAYVIPRLQEVFPRSIHDPANERSILTWNLCTRPNKAGLHNSKDVEIHIQAKGHHASL